MSLDQLINHLTLPKETIVFCKSTKAITNSESEQLQNYGAFPGDVVRGTKSSENPDTLAIVRHPYKEDFGDDVKSAPIPFKNASNIPQILFIKAPISCNANNNYLPALQTNIQNIHEAIINSRIFSAEICNEILQYLPFTFPILISCTSVYRGRSSWTHFTYPFTKRKDKIIKYWYECGQIFDAMDDCEYVFDFYLMKDDVPMEAATKSRDIARDANAHIPYTYDANTFERVYSAPLLICRDRANSLKELSAVNDVGGSLWCTIEFNCQHDAEWSEDVIEELDIDWLDCQEKKLDVRIGGSSGIKSRAWFQVYMENQTNPGKPMLQKKYLPMVVVSVELGASALQSLLK